MVLFEIGSFLRVYRNAIWHMLYNGSRWPLSYSLPIYVFVVTKLKKMRMIPMQSNKKKTTAHLFLLFIIFLFPVIAGWFLYFYHDQFHFKTTNHGALVSPPIAI